MRARRGRQQFLDLASDPGWPKDSYDRLRRFRIAAIRADRRSRRVHLPKIAAQFLCPSRFLASASFASAIERNPGESGSFLLDWGGYQAASNLSL